MARTQPHTQAGNFSVPKGRLWAGRILSFLPALFLLLDGIMKVFKPTFVVEATVKLGYSERVIVPLGIVLVICTLIYLIPRTAVLGAILLTGHLGGAVATHVRAEQGWFEIFFPIVIGILLWSELALRNDRVRSLVSLRDTSGEPS